jgi:hypothetical protein
MLIRDFFPSDPSAWPDEHYVIASAIPLSRERLFDSPVAAIANQPRERGKNIAISRTRLRDVKKDRRSGPEILADYRASDKNGRSRRHTPDLFTYDFEPATIAGHEGFHVLRPDVQAELRRRSKIFRTRLAKYQEWLHDIQRTQEAYIHSAVRSVMQQDRSKESYIDKKKYDAWKKADLEQYKRHYWPVHYGLENLLHWLRSRHVKEVLRDYSFGADDHQTAGAELYRDGIKDIFHEKMGAEYLGKEYSDRDSYLAQSTRLLELKPEYITEGAFTNSYVEIRKWNNVVFGLLEEIAPVLVAKEKSRALTMIVNLVAEKTGHVLSTVRVTPSTIDRITVEVADVESFLKKAGSLPNSKGGKAVVTFVEGVNVGLAVYGLSQSSDGFEVAKATVNLIGATLDFGSSNWLVINALKNKFGALKGARFITGMIFVSGVIDCILGIWGVIDAWKEGEYDVAIGWAIFALGGAIVAWGAWTKMIGAQVTVGSGGAAAKPGVAVIVVGLLVEAVGLAVVWLCSNDEIGDWLTGCMFGDKPRGSTTQQIQGLNDILTKFEVDGSFKDTEMRWQNHTCVTVEIKPRVITDRSILRFSNVRALARARWSEYIFGTSKDLVSGGSGSANPVLNLANPHNCSIEREDGRIVKIVTNLHYRMDIDEVLGTIQLDINNGTLQGATQQFALKA